MHQLGDQWIEIIDGQEHMVKAVEKISEKSYNCTGCIFNGHNGNCMYHSQDCPLGEVEYGYIKDLGILRDGLLPEERTGKYPTYVVEKRFGEHMDEEKHWHKFYVFSNGTNVEAGGWTFQEAKDAWNRRA